MEYIDYAIEVLTKLLIEQDFKEKKTGKTKKKAVRYMCIVLTKQVWLYYNIAERS